MSDRAPAQSAYRVLAADLRTGILQGTYPSGAQLPTEAELASKYGVSRQTVRRAFQDIVAEGLVLRVPGRGTFVKGTDGQYLRHFGSIEDLMALSQDTDFELLDPLRRRVDVAAASRLRLDADVVSSVRFRRVHDGVPFCLTTVHLPPEVGARLRSAEELLDSGPTRITIIGLLDRVLDSPISSAEQSVTACPLPTDLAPALEAQPDEPVLRVDRLYSTDAGQPVELAISYFLPEHYSYRVQLRRTAQ